MATYLMSTTVLNIQKMSDIAPRTSSLEGSLAKMLGKTYKGEVPAHEASGLWPASPHCYGALKWQR